MTRQSTLRARRRGTWLEVGVIMKKGFTENDDIRMNLRNISPGGEVEETAYIKTEQS